MHDKQFCCAGILQSVIQTKTWQAFCNLSSKINSPTYFSTVAFTSACVQAQHQTSNHAQLLIHCVSVQESVLA